MWRAALVGDRYKGMQQNLLDACKCIEPWESPEDMDYLVSLVSREVARRKMDAWEKSDIEDAIRGPFQMWYKKHLEDINIEPQPIALEVIRWRKEEGQEHRRPEAKELAGQPGAPADADGGGHGGEGR